MWSLMFQMKPKTNKTRNTAPIYAQEASPTTEAIVCTNMAAVVVDVAATTVAKSPEAAVIADLAAVVTDADSVPAAAQTDQRIVSTEIIATQWEGSVLRETCASPA